MNDCEMMIWSRLPLQAVPEVFGVHKVLFVVSWVKKITFNHTNDSDASIVVSLLGAHAQMFNTTNTKVGLHDI
jgi:hypothetical protein